MLFENEGYCSICEGSARFVAEQAWLRDHYVGVKCQSIPRQRAVVWVLNLHNLIFILYPLIPIKQYHQ